MPGVVFLIVVPTANFEQEIQNEIPSAIVQPTAAGSNLNINLPEKNAILRLEVELRDKNARRRPNRKAVTTDRNRAVPTTVAQVRQTHPVAGNANNFFVPLEKVLEELLTKLDIEHVTWQSDKKGFYHTVIFPIPAGDPCETTLHCLTQLGIGIKPGSSVSVMPCSVTYDAITEIDEETTDVEKTSKWNNFVDGIRSKLTVKQVVDGVRNGGSLSFDYLLLIVTADSLAALGLIENNAPNITAAMLVSPLMGPVMSITFGIMISDRQLVKSGFIALAAGMLISLLFGFVFGLIVGATDQPWGLGDFPTDEMRGRGNARSLWMGVAWALTSGSGVALALLLGASGPLIGVAISASLLPPVVNCGIFWALSCIWLIRHDDKIKLPHIKGEPYTGNSSFVPFYSSYMPTEFCISGIVSASLTIVNIMCIFITAIIVLKIKEVSAPYTSSPDLRRFWETDIRAVRRSNKSTIRRKYSKKAGPSTTLDNILENDTENGENLGTALQQALKEAVDDETFRKVKRMSYSSNAADEITKRLGIPPNAKIPGNNPPSASTIRNSKINADLNVLDQLVSSLLERQNQTATPPPSTSHTNDPSKLSRLRSLSFRSRRHSSHKGPSASVSSSNNELNLFASPANGFGQNANAMPTILESGSSGSGGPQSQPTTSSLDRHRTSSVRQILNTIKNAPHRLSQSMDGHQRLHDEESSNLTRNMLD